MKKKVLRLQWYQPLVLSGRIVGVWRLEPSSDRAQAAFASGVRNSYLARYFLRGLEIFTIDARAVIKVGRHYRRRLDRDEIRNDLFYWGSRVLIPDPDDSSIMYLVDPVAQVRFVAIYRRIGDMPVKRREDWVVELVTPPTVTPRSGHTPLGSNTTSSFAVSTAGSSATAPSSNPEAVVRVAAAESDPARADLLASFSGSSSNPREPPYNNAEPVAPLISQSNGKDRLSQSAEFVSASQQRADDGQSDDGQSDDEDESLPSQISSGDFEAFLDQIFGQTFDSADVDSENGPAKEKGYCRYCASKGSGSAFRAAVEHLVWRSKAGFRFCLFSALVFSITATTEFSLIDHLRGSGNFVAQVAKLRHLVEGLFHFFLLEILLYNYVCINL